MTQSHLPRTGRGVTETVDSCDSGSLPAFSKEDAGFFVPRYTVTKSEQHGSHYIIGGKEIMALIDVPHGVTVIAQILEKTLKNGMLVEVYLVKTQRQYEAALFVEGHYKSGPPVPRPTDNPTETAAYWMGVRPSVGLSQEEGDDVLAEVNVQNKLHHINFMDKWGVVED